MNDKKELPLMLSNPYKITLYKNGNNPNIYYYFSWNKISYRGSTGTNIIDESIKKSGEIFYEVTKGLREKGVKKNIKFEKLVKEFLKHKEHEVSARTIDDYKKSSKYLIERYKSKEIEKICDKSEYSNYQSWRRNYYETHKSRRRQLNFKDGNEIIGRKLDHVGNVVINRELRLLVSILRFGKEYKKLFKGISIPSYKMLPEKRREDILTLQEYFKLKKYWMEKKPYYGHIISFLINTGIRYPSELNRIQWKDVNLGQSYVIIRNRKSKSNPITSSVPLVESSKKVIEYLKSRDGISKKPDDYVFVDDNGKQIKRISRSFKNSLKECGIDKNVTMYSFRHIFTTRMVKRTDIPLPILSLVLGHTNTNTLQKYYTHLNPKDIVRTFQHSEENLKQILKEKKIKKQTDQQPKTTT